MRVEEDTSETLESAEDDANKTWSCSCVTDAFKLVACRDRFLIVPAIVAMTRPRTRVHALVRGLIVSIITQKWILGLKWMKHVGKTYIQLL